MMTANHFLNSVIKPVLIDLELGGPAAEELLLGTAMQESMNFKYRRQIGGGPARGFYQMEPATHDDIWNNYLKYHSKLAKKVEKMLSSAGANKIAELENNDRYATAMARVHYLRVSEPLPAAGDTKAQAEYWKEHYNTPLGKGKVSEYIEKWNAYANK